MYFYYKLRLPSQPFESAFRVSLLSPDKSLSMTQSLLNLGRFMSLDLLHISSCSVVGNSNLIERILGTLVKLLSDSLLALVQAQANAAAICLHLGEPSLLVLGKGGGKSSLRMFVNLGVVRSGR